MQTEAQIRKELAETLNYDPHNYSKILELSSKLSEFDKERIRFNVDAGVIDRLGKELVARHETAVSELVKNAYDADAVEVNLNFINSDRPGGKLEIDDNGTGMSRAQLLNGFMTISSSEKIHNPKSPRFERTRAGQKGIGRFATQRLGSVLSVVTQTKESNIALKLTINWNEFNTDSSIFLIENTIEEVEKTKEEGTTLFISDLREGWTDQMIKRAYRYISDLLQPFPLSGRLEQSNNDPGFKVSFFKDGVIIVDEQSAFFEHSLAEIEAYVDNDGVGFYSIKSSKLDLDDDVFSIGKKERSDPYTFLKNVHLKAYYFIYNSGLIPKKVETYVRENAEHNGGIRLYRNGFRVLPYGEKGDDWLGLDASTRRRTIIAPHGNNNFYGFIEVFDIKGENFQEQSSREGLIENEALLELKDFAYKVLTDVAIKVSNARGRKATAGQRNWAPKSSRDIIQETKQDVQNLVNTIGYIAVKSDTPPPSSISSQEINESLKKIEEKLDEVQIVTEQENKEKEELLKEIQLLRILAGLGVTIGEFVHELSHYGPAFKYDSEYLVDHSSDPLSKQVAERLQTNLDAFTVYTSYFEQAISENINRELRPIEIRDVVFRFIDVIKPDSQRNEIEIISPYFRGYELFTVPMHFSEWASIMFNLYTNSKKAIKRAQRKGKIFLSGGKESNKVYLEFSDNGDGIPPENRNKIFEAFYTTSAPKSNSSTQIEELTGTGLGLKIVSDIIEGYGGEIEVKDPIDGYSTTIRIELPLYKKV